MLNEFLKKLQCGEMEMTARITVDGKPIEGNVIKATPGKHVVEVIM